MIAVRELVVEGAEAVHPRGEAGDLLNNNKLLIRRNHNNNKKKKKKNKLL